MFTYIGLFRVAPIAREHLEKTPEYFETIHKIVEDEGGTVERFLAVMPPSLAATDEAPREGGDWRRIVLDRRSRTVLLPPGCAIDLGGIAKGMATDAAIRLVTRKGVKAALISAGGDLCVHGLPPAARACRTREGQWSPGQLRGQRICRARSQP